MDRVDVGEVERSGPNGWTWTALLAKAVDRIDLQALVEQVLFQAGPEPPAAPAALSGIYFQPSTVDAINRLDVASLAADRRDEAE